GNDADHAGGAGAVHDAGGVVGELFVVQVGVRVNEFHGGHLSPRAGHLTGRGGMSYCVRRAGRGQAGHGSGWPCPFGTALLQSAVIGRGRPLEGPGGAPTPARARKLSMKAGVLRLLTVSRQHWFLIALLVLFAGLSVQYSVKVMDPKGTRSAIVR